MTPLSLIIATRESPLALWQANWVKMRLEVLYPQLQVTLLGLTTSGDQVIDIALLPAGGKGLFVKELENALLEGRADIAVHSMKDVPMHLPPGLCLPIICEREDPRDVFVSNRFASLSELPSQAKVGTSSLRRQSQLYAARSDIFLENLHGNVNTRLRRLDQDEFAAIILAAAGLKRLNLQDRIRSYLSPEQSLPAAGQGVLGIECRIDDLPTQTLIAALNDAVSYTCVTAERAMCRHLGGGCHTPIAAYATIDSGQILLRGLVARPDGSLLLRAEHSVPMLSDAEALGITVAEDLLQQGAAMILTKGGI
jgi:hydroxymethylbilane synthase